jgi:sigma-E factor negative regulatory protein RseA
MQMLTDDHDSLAAARERLSALADGELDADTAPLACSHWAQSAQSRATWHAYHLIGDVLRSEDLAGDPASDARFLAAFRARLAEEPVVLAPRPLAWAVRDRNDVLGGRKQGPVGRHWGWLVPSAVAAGFVAVAGGLVLTRAPETSIAADRAQTRLAAAPSAAASMIEGPPQTYIANGQLIRDARLDRYLAAHQQFAGSSVLGVPSVFVRNATADAADR